MTMTLTTPVAETSTTATGDAGQPRTEEAPSKPAARKSAGRKAKTIELVLTVTGTADGEWRAEIETRIEAWRTTIEGGGLRQKGRAPRSSR